MSSIANNPPGQPREDCRKGIVYAAGGLAELHPLTSVVPKALLPVYDKPLIYYALSVLMLGGIRRVALVIKPEDRDAFARLLADGNRFGIELEYLEQEHSAGPAHALVTSLDFIGRDSVTMILADCLVYADGLQRVLHEAMHNRGATLFAHPLATMPQYGVVELDAAGRPRSISPFTARGPANLAIMGIFFYDRDVVEIATGLAESTPNFTLSDVHQSYLAQGRLHVRRLGRGFAWLDTSTPASLHAATNFIETIESTHGLKIACLEEIAYQKGFITTEQLAEAARGLNNAYGAYLRRCLAGEPGTGKANADSTLPRSVRQDSATHD